MKKTSSEIRRQNTPDLSLDRQILERAKHLRAGKKRILSEERKERNGMKISMNKAESSEAAIVRKTPGALIAAAAAVVMVIGGSVTAIMNGRTDIEPAANTSSSMVQPEETSAAVKQAPEQEAVTPDTDDSTDDSGVVTTIVTKEVPDAEVTTVGENEPVQPSPEPVAEWAKGYLAKNSDTAGYIHIPGFDNDGEYRIDQPVVQRDGDGWKYYLDHDFYGEPARRGALVTRSDFGGGMIKDGKQPDNTVIYGYNATDEEPQTDAGYDEAESSMMFTGLKQYQRGIDFYREHAVINFKSIYEEDESEYVIFAVFNHDPTTETAFVNTTDFSGFTFAFDNWLIAVNDASYYTCDINCTAEDKYLTLVTPVHPESDPNNCRTIIAKKLTPQDDKQAIINSVQLHAPDPVNEDTEAGENSDAEMRIEIPVPNGVRGTYSFDIYKEGNPAYSKTVTNIENKAGTFVSMDIEANDGDKIDIYVRSLDLEEENYVHYGWFKFTYLENVGFSSDADFDEEALLKLSALAAGE